jgi:hypothetical protein
MMTIPAVQQVADRRVALWALLQIDHASALGDGRRAEALGRLFDPPAIFRWLFESRDQLVAGRLLETLPAEQLEPFFPALVAAWEGLSGPVAAQAATRMAARRHPGLLPLLERTAATLDLTKETPLLAGLTQAARHFGAGGIPLLRILLERIEKEHGPAALQWSGCLRVAARLGVPGAPGLVARTLSAMADSMLDMESLLEEVFGELAPGSPFLALLFDREYRRRGYLLEDLPELFVEGIPLAELDRLAETAGASHMTAALSLLRSEIRVPELAGFALEFARQLGALRHRDAEKAAFLFVLAAAAAQSARTDFKFEGCDLQHMLDLLTCDVEQLPCAEPLAESILAVVTRADAPRLVAELSAAMPYRGCQRLVRLMGRLGWPEFIGPLLASLGEEADPAGAHAAAESLAKLGKPALEAIVARWLDMDLVQQVNALDVFAAAAAAGTEGVAEALAVLLPRVRDDDFFFDLWCAAAESVADPSLLPLLEAEVHREDSEAGRAAETIRAVGRS